MTDVHFTSAFRRLPKRLLALIVCVAPTLFVPVQAEAQALTVSDAMAPALDDAGFISLPGTATPGHLRANVTLGSDLSFDARQRSLVGGRAHVDRRWRALASVQVGVGERLAIALTVPAVLSQVGELPSVSTAVADAPAALPRRSFGDTRVQARYRLFGTVPDGSGVRADGPGLGALVAFDLPTGDKAALTGEGQPRSELSLLADFQVLGAGAGIKLGWLHRPEVQSAGPFRLQDRLVYGLGARVPMPFYPALSGLFELRGEADFAEPQGAPLEALLGARLQLKPWTLTLSGGAQLASAYGAPAGRVMLAVRVTPEDPDADGDGIVDAADECPFLPEDRDGFEDEDGCEDPDNDNDLIPDVDDLCPNEEAAVDGDLNEDGCTDKKP